MASKMVETDYGSLKENSNPVKTKSFPVSLYDALYWQKERDFV